MFLYSLCLEQYINRILWTHQIYQSKPPPCPDLLLHGSSISPWFNHSSRFTNKTTISATIYRSMEQGPVRSLGAGDDW
ncbi:hypothetical protein BLNAU_20045 [Blattamonas nauphoetae]|uniref:Uncharacterized protein n=1 Tax=Blattamonas nauphoetae TaxID=2049346 RepID=A0ABQ9WZT7_9EUKA|nr:hypothetical protein BLNAU_20045 [Blattamonas nauphoetae]